MKVSATKIDLLILGLLLDRPMYGYEIYQQIRAEGIDTWFNVSMAGVYYSLAKLRDQGLLVESQQRSRRSTGKAIYHLTEEGRAAFFAAMQEQAVNHSPVALDYDLVIYLMNRLPLSQAKALLQQRLSDLTQQRQAVEADLSQECLERPSLRAVVLDHRRRYLDMERQWLSDVMRDVEGQDLGRPRGLMVLRGDLGHFHLPDLLRLIVSARHSGTLTITHEMDTRSITFEAGWPLCASFLRHGEVVVPPTPGGTQELLFDLFRWQEGEFTFDQELICAECCIPLDLSADDLILGGSRWVDNWAIIQRLVPSGDTMLELCATPERLADLKLTPVERQIAAQLNGVKTVTALAGELGLTVFETSRALYSLVAVGVARSADRDKVRLRRAFREIAELMCSSTIAWRGSPDERTCEQEVNQLCRHLPVALNQGRIEDLVEPRLPVEQLVEVYRSFLLTQLDVVSRRFGRENARRSFERTLRQLAPELREVTHRYGLNQLLPGP